MSDKKNLSLNPVRLKVSRVRMGVEISEIAVVGDDAQLEVPMAKLNGALAVYVHTGTGGANAFDMLPQPTWPDISVANIAELMELYQASE